MSRLVRFLGWLYILSLKVYPPDFQANFGEEMRAVFTQAIEEHLTIRSLLIFLLRELKDLPGSLLIQHWLAFKKEEPPMTAISASEDLPQTQMAELRQPGTVKAAFLAGLPHLIMGLLIGLGKLGFLDSFQDSLYGGAIIGIGLALLVFTVLIFAWRRGWPLWSASWYLYGTWVVIAIIGLTIETLDLQDAWRYTNALTFGWILLCILGYFAIVAKSRLHGLLSIAFLFPVLGVLFLEFIPNPIEGWLAIGLGLLAALAAGVIVRIGEFRLALAIVLSINLFSGIALAYVSEYQMQDIPRGIPVHVPKFSSFLELFAVYCVVALGVVLIPFILRGLWNFGRRKLSF